jgi:hypothetical protein
MREGRVCYAQWEDAGPMYEDDAAYVFGTARPRNERTPRYANGTGIDVSPAVRDCLGFRGVNNADNRVDWQFVTAAEVPTGPWRQIVTTSGVFWE